MSARMAQRTLFFAALFLAFSTLVTLPSGSFAQTQPGKEHAILKDLEGTWDAVIRTEGTESKGTAIYKMELGGLWLTSDFSADFGGSKFQGRGIDGYDQHAKKYVSIWVDSMTSSVMTFEGTYDEATKTLTLHGEGRGHDGEAMKFKSTSQSKDKDHHTFSMFMVDANGKESRMMTIEYSRKK